MSKYQIGFYFIFVKMNGQIYVISVRRIEYIQIYHIKGIANEPLNFFIFIFCRYLGSI